MALPHVFWFCFIFLFFNLNWFFLNEEFLIALCLIILYIFIYFALRKLLRFALFHKCDFIYFYFYFLLTTLLSFYNILNSLLHLFSMQFAAFYALEVNYLFAQFWYNTLKVARERLSNDFLFSGFFFNLCFSHLYYFSLAQWGHFVSLELAEEFSDDEGPFGYIEEDEEDPAEASLIFLLYSLDFECAGDARDFL